MKLELLTSTAKELKEYFIHKNLILSSMYNFRALLKFPHGIKVHYSLQLVQSFHILQN